MLKTFFKGCILYLIIDNILITGLGLKFQNIYELITDLCKNTISQEFTSEPT